MTAARELLDRFKLEVTEAEVPLVPWEELGLRALGGQVSYRTTVEMIPDAECRTVLDLGEVRGTADVRVNGTLAARLVWGPWRAELTGVLRPGRNDVEGVVRGTLVGYLDDASPTGGVYAGQVRTGLLGPVVLHRHARRPLSPTEQRAAVDLEDLPRGPARIR